MTDAPRNIWFARRFPIGHPRSGMAPVNWKGWMAVAIFIMAMLIGAAGFAWFALRDMLAQGVAIFMACAAGAGLWLIRMTNHNGDHIHTIADYEKGRLRV